MGRVLRICGILAAVYLAIVGLAWIFQRRLIYIPMGRAPNAGSVLPAATDVTIDTEDGLRLGAWFVPADAPDPRGAILVFNGNAGNRSFRAPLAAALAKNGLTVLLFDYRGYSGNRGSPTEEGLLADARAARAYLDSKADLDPERTVYFGESLGAAVAVAAAVERPPAALILRSPFSSLTAMGKLHYPFLPVKFLLKDRFPSIERIRRLSCPLLVLAGDRDQIVPAEDSRTLFEAANMKEKRFVTIPGADHNDDALLDGTRLIREVTGFLEEVLPPTADDEWGRKLGD
jgi:fermentation-respiration switch protein FrsA (DUF1100 family)